MKEKDVARENESTDHAEWDTTDGEIERKRKRKKNCYGTATILLLFF